MATFEALMADHSVVSARRARWALANDHVDLPPVIDGARGPWCVTHFFDGRDSEPRQCLAIEFTGAGDDWEPYVSLKGTSDE